MAANRPVDLRNTFNSSPAHFGLRGHPAAAAEAALAEEAVRALELVTWPQLSAKSGDASSHSPKLPCPNITNL